MDLIVSRCFFFSLVILLFSFPSWAQNSSEKCYLAIEKTGQFEEEIVSLLSISLVSKYIKPVEPIPYEGVGNQSCLFRISIAEAGETLFLSLLGKDLHSFGNSKLGGTDGLQQALLRSIYKTSPSNGSEMCDAYSAFLEEDCKKLPPTQMNIPKKEKSDKPKKGRADKAGITVTPEAKNSNSTFDFLHFAKSNLIRCAHPMAKSISIRAKYLQDVVEIGEYLKALVKIEYKRWVKVYSMEVEMTYWVKQKMIKAKVLSDSSSLGPRECTFFSDWKEL